YSSAPPALHSFPTRRSSDLRNNKGHITSRYMGGGHKRQYRRIDFRRDKFGVPAKVASVEYDPNRTARIALLHYADGEKRYILARSEEHTSELQSRFDLVCRL